MNLPMYAVTLQKILWQQHTTLFLNVQQSEQYTVCNHLRFTSISCEEEAVQGKLDPGPNN